MVGKRRGRCFTSNLKQAPKYIVRFQAPPRGKIVYGNNPHLTFRLHTQKHYINFIFPI